MMRWIILCVAVVALAAISTLVTQLAGGYGPKWDLPAPVKTKGPQPKVAVEGPLTHEFGPMATQKTGTHRWVVKNEGEGNLEITLGASSCMCTVAKLKQEGAKEVVKPGSSTTIDVEWKTKDAVGDFSKNVTIASNDLNQPEFKLTVHGTVSTPITVLPQPQEGVVSIGTVATDKASNVVLAIFSQNRPDFKLTSVTTSKPDLFVPKISPLTEDDHKKLNTKGGYRLNLEIKPGLGLGDFREQLVIATDNPDEPKLDLTLSGTASGPITVMPSRLEIMALDSKNGDMMRQVTLLVREGRPTTFTVAHKPASVSVEVAPNDTSNAKGRYRIMVTLPAGAAAGRVEDSIILKTDHPSAAEVKIPVSIVVGAG